MAMFAVEVTSNCSGSKGFSALSYRVGSSYIARFHGTTSDSSVAMEDDFVVCVAGNGVGSGQTVEMREGVEGKAEQVARNSHYHIE